MKTIKLTTRYKKDFKRYRHKTDKLKNLMAVIEYLKNELPVPSCYSPHQLSGEYEGCMECHIESDFLLVWIDPNSDIIYLERLGSHSEIFKHT